MTEDEAWTSCVGKGWRPLVQQMLDALKGKGRVGQVKEKFGGLRFSYDLTEEGQEKLKKEGWGSDEFYGYINGLEAAAWVICEDCGTTQDVTTEGRWILTLCRSCRRELERKKREVLEAASKDR